MTPVAVSAQDVSLQLLRASFRGCSSASHHFSAACGPTAPVCDYTGVGTSWWSSG